jgi:hypothetical protein
MRIARLILVATLAAACSSSPAAPSALTFHDGDSTLTNLPAGRYAFSWTATGCTFLEISWAPTTGPATIVVRTGFDGAADPALLPKGSATVAIAGGSAYINHGGNCPNEIRVQPAG